MWITLLDELIEDYVEINVDDRFDQDTLLLFVSYVSTLKPTAPRTLEKVCFLQEAE